MPQCFPNPRMLFILISHLKKPLRNRIILLAIAFLPFLGYGQNSDLGNWFIYFGNYSMNSRWNFHHEVQYRNYDALGDLEQLLLRTGIGYNLTEKNHNLLLGYGYIESKNYAVGQEEKIKIDEHRIFQQFITRHRLSSVFLQHRFRLEERFIERDFKLRFRYFLAANIPLNRVEMTNKTLYISAYNELFLNTTNSIFDRNRVYGGLGYQLNPRLRFELGYMNQFLETGSRDQINIIFFVNL